MKFFTKVWPFYMCAAAFVLILLLHMYLLDEPVTLQSGLSAVSDYGRSAIENKDYRTPPPLNHSTGLILGILIGGGIGALCSKKFKLKLKSSRLSGVKTIITCVVGGFLIMIGGEIGGDMFLGQIVSAMQLSSGAWVYLGCAFLSAGIITTFWFNTTEQRQKNPTVRQDATGAGSSGKGIEK